MIKCFKWFSKVLLRLKPRDFDFATSSSSKYNTTFLLVPIAFASEGMRREALCYKFGLNLARAKQETKLLMVVNENLIHAKFFSVLIELLFLKPDRGLL